MGGSRPIVILGASGFLGPHLVRAAAAYGALSIVAVSRRPAGFLWGVEPGGVEPARAAVREQAVDLSDPAALARLFDGLEDARVVNVAGLNRPADCDRDPALARRMNAEVPERLARLCARRGVRLVHVSTDLVFGAAPPRGSRYAEDDPPSPCDTYGASKAAGESAVLAACGDALVVRLPLLFGDSGGRGLGASDQITAQLARGERPFLFTDEHRTPLDAADAAAALIELVHGTEAGVLHVAGPDRLSRLELALLVLRHGGMSASEARAALDSGPRAARGAAGRAADASLDASRARTLLATRLRSPAEALRAGIA